MRGPAGSHAQDEVAQAAARLKNGVKTASLRTSTWRPAAGPSAGTPTIGAVQQRQPPSHLDASVQQLLWSKPREHGAAAASRPSNRSAADVGYGSAVERQSSAAWQGGPAALQAGAAANTCVSGAGSGCGGSLPDSRTVGSSWAGPSSSNQQQLLQQVPPQAGPVVHPAGGTPATVPLADIGRLWQQWLDSGHQPLTEGSWDAFICSQQDLASSVRETDVRNRLKEQLMGDPEPLIASAISLQKEERVNWEQSLSRLQHNLSGLVQIGKPQTKADTDHRATGHNRKEMTATASVRLPAAAQQPQATTKAFTASSSSSSLVAKQPLEAAYLQVKVKVKQKHEKKQAKLSRSKSAAEVQAGLRKEALPQLHAHTAALLQWQLQWQLPAHQRQHLEADGFELLVLPTTTASLPMAPTLGMGRILNVGSCVCGFRHGTCLSWGARGGLCGSVVLRLCFVRGLGMERAEEAAVPYVRLFCLV